MGSKHYGQITGKAKKLRLVALKKSMRNVTWQKPSTQLMLGSA